MRAMSALAVGAAIAISALAGCGRPSVRPTAPGRIADVCIQPATNNDEQMPRYVDEIAGRLTAAGLSTKVLVPRDVVDKYARAMPLVKGTDYDKKFRLFVYVSMSFARVRAGGSYVPKGGGPPRSASGYSVKATLRLYGPGSDTHFWEDAYDASPKFAGKIPDPGPLRSYEVPTDQTRFNRACRELVYQAKRAVR